MSKSFRSMKIAALGLVVTAASFPAMRELDAHAGTAPSIEGTFALQGKGDDGSKYNGTATITKIGGDMYTASWKIGANAFHGNCFRDDDDLSCGWALKPKDANVVAYLVQSDGLDGVWFGAGNNKLGKEYLKATSTPKANLSGNYTIAKGENPDGSKYSGSVKLTQLTDLGEADYRFDWVIGGSKIQGLGVRNTDAGQDDVISVGFSSAGGDCGALQYNIDAKGTVLKGRWIQSIGGKIADGEEIASKP